MSTVAEYYKKLADEMQSLRDAGTYKELRYLQTPMDAYTEMEGYGRTMIMSSNNYLGLSNLPEVKEAGKAGIDKYGAGTASVRFICGTFDIHRELEQEIASFLKTEACLTYVSCWSANESAIPVACGAEGVVISDELNHASIIDGCRLIAKGVQKARYKHSDMADLEAQLKQFPNAPVRLIVTDGVFSMEGDVAKLPEIVALAKKYEALVMVDESHATGVIGKTGRGTAEYYGLEGQIDIISGTLGKALGGAAGGVVAGKKCFVEALIQKSRPQLFSNALPPTVACSALAALRVLEREPERAQRLRDKASYLRNKLKEAGFKPLDGDGAIVPIIVGDDAFAISISNKLLKKGLFVTGFGFPVVPRGTARIRCQVSDALELKDLDWAVEQFKEVGKEVGLI